MHHFIIVHLTEDSDSQTCLNNKKHLLLRYGHLIKASCKIMSYLAKIFGGVLCAEYGSVSTPITSAQSKRWYKRKNTSFHIRKILQQKIPQSPQIGHLKMEVLAKIIHELSKNISDIKKKSSYACWESRSFCECNRNIL